MSSQRQPEYIIEEELVCRAGFQCFQRPCPSTWWCDELGISWEIPYTRTPEALIVKSLATRYEKGYKQYNYMDMDFGDPPIRNEEYVPIYDFDMTGHRGDINSRILETWFAAGWCAAIPLLPKLTQQPEPDDCDELDIPF
jgi:hypothetical protein